MPKRKKDGWNLWERKTFSAKTYLKVKREFDRQRKLPDNAPTWRMTRTQWTAISKALKIAADHSLTGKG